MNGPFKVGFRAEKTALGDHFDGHFTAENYGEDIVGDIEELTFK